MQKKIGKTRMHFNCIHSCLDWFVCHTNLEILSLNQFKLKIPVEHRKCIFVSKSIFMVELKVKICNVTITIPQPKELKLLMKT